MPRDSFCPHIRPDPVAYVGAVTKDWLLALGYFILMPLTFYFALYCASGFKTTLRDSKVRRFTNRTHFIKRRRSSWKRGNGAYPIVI
jgi:hypothetical protein